MAFFLGSRLNVLLQLEADAGRSKGCTVAVDEDGLVVNASLLFQQRFEHSHRLRPKRTDSSLATRAKQLNLRAGVSKRIARGHTSSASWMRAPVLWMKTRSA